MNGKSFSFKSKTGEGCSARTNVLVDVDSGVITLQRIMISIDNKANLEVIRKFSGYMVLFQEFAIKDTSMFTICQGLFDEEALKHLYP